MARKKGDLKMNVKEKHHCFGELPIGTLGTFDCKSGKWRKVKE